MTIALRALTVVAALLLAAFCAGAETGIFSLNRGRIVHMAREGSKAAIIIERALQEASRTLTGLLVGNNLGSVVFSSASAALAEKLCADGGAGLPVLVHPGVIGADRDCDDVLVLVHGVGTLDFKLLATHVVHGVLEELERGAEGEFDALAVLAEVVFDDEVDEAVFAAVQRDIHAVSVVHDFHDFLVRGGRDEEAEGERFAEEVELAVIPRGGLVEGRLAVRNLGARAVNHLQRDCFGDAVDGLDGFEKAENSVHCVSPFDMPSM